MVLGEGLAWEMQGEQKLGFQFLMQATGMAVLC